MEEIIRLKKLIEQYRKLPPEHPNYLGDHFNYLKLEEFLDSEVMKYFIKTGKGKLNDKGYFKD